MPTLRIVTPDSPGLINDATIYRNIFEYYHFDVVLIRYAYAKRPTTLQQFCDFNLFLENIGWDNIANIFPSNVNLFMPNYELFYDFKKLSQINYVLCKTHITFEMFEFVKKEHNHSYRCVY